MFKAALFIVIVSLLGCGKATESTVIRFGLQSAPITLDPRMATDASAERINRLIYRPLVDVDDDLRAVPILAGWEKLSPKHYRFTLKPDNILFSNGKKLTSHDVYACYQYILDKKNASPHQGNLIHIEKVKVLDEARIDFYLSRADILFPARLTIGIPSAESVSIGNGPFKILSADSLLDVTLLRRSDKQRFSFLHAKDPSIRVLKVLRGELDIIQNDLQPELVRYLQRKNGVSVQKSSGTTFSYIGFNLEDPLTSQYAVRKAISLAIDRNKLIKSLLGGQARLSHSLLPLKHWARQEMMPKILYQPELARKILEKAGFGLSNRPKIIYKTTTDPLRLRIATVIQKQLFDVGIDVEIRSYDWGTFYADIKSGNFQMYSLSWVGINSPDIYQTVFHSQSIPPKGANRGRYNSSDVDALLDEAFVKVSDEKVLPILIDKIQRLLLKDLPYIPLWFEDNVAIMSTRVQGYSLSGNGNYDALTQVNLVRYNHEAE